MITLKQIQKAAKTIEPFVHKTPLIYSSYFSSLTECEVYVKAENLQKTGSFKVRGAFNKLSAIKKGKVVAASMGNHAQAVAHAASTLGLKSRIIMPENAPIVKEEATRGYGAEVILHGQRFSDALDYAKSLKNFHFIHTFDDDEIIAGQGTIGLEICKELPEPDYILVPVGGGGLISGVAVAIKSLSPKTKIIGIQTKSATSAFFSFKEKKIIKSSPLPTLADGIAIGKIGKKNFELIIRNVSDILLVDEDSIAMAIFLFLERKKMVVEGAGASPLAAFLEHAPKFRGKKVVLLASGGNIDFMVMDRIIHRGLLKAGRIAEIQVILDDKPGSLNLFTGIISSCNANIISVEHRRLQKDLAFGKTIISCTLEIRNKEHVNKIHSKLAEKELKVIELTPEKP